MKIALTFLFWIAAGCNVSAADGPVTYIRGNSVRWDRVCLQIPDRFAPIGALDFTLPRSAGTRTIFVDTSGKAVLSMVAVQTEHMTNQADKYEYPLLPGIQVDGIPFKVNAFAASDTLNARSSPHAETALTMQFLAQHGFQAPDEWLKVRYATYDSSGRNEFLLFYMEPLDTTALDLAAVGPSDLIELTKAFDRVRQRAGANLKFSDCE